MRQTVHYFKIGVFVLLSLAVLIAGLILLGAETWWGDVILFETFLDESVQGLDIGSPVLQRGVNIGRIKEIGFIAQAYPEQAGPGAPSFEQFGSRVRIVMELDQKHFLSYAQDRTQFYRNLERIIERGFRIKLSYQGITGLAFLEGDFVDSQRNPPQFPDWKTEYIYLPSTPSLITSFTSALENVFQRLNTIDFEALFSQIESTLASIQRITDEVEARKINESVVSTLDDIRQTSGELRRFLEQAQEPNLPQQFADTLAQFNRSLNRIETMFAGNEPEVEVIVENLREMSELLRDFARSVIRDPAQLLFSRPPAPSEVYQ